MSSYLYRCTEQQLENHLQRIAEAGDAVEHVVYKGGRDYVLVCRKGTEPIPVRIVWDQDELTQAVRVVRSEVRELARRLDR